MSIPVVLCRKNKHTYMKIEQGDCVPYCLNCAIADLMDFVFTCRNVLKTIDISSDIISLTTLEMLHFYGSVK